MAAKPRPVVQITTAGLARAMTAALATQRGAEQSAALHDAVVRLSTDLQALDRLVAETRLSDRRALDIADVANKTALSLATGNLDKRLDDLNELRGNVISADRYEADQAAFTARVTPLERAQSAGAGASLGNEKNLRLVLAVIAAISVAAALFFGFRGPRTVNNPTPAVTVPARAGPTAP